ncbi:MAG: macro domain-containing protein [Halobacteriovoraceae bacterium]|jgi:O-acetyl-ADP-ribose deacetylase (regulator of RNase III)|nr:macro domain-containing protein [Halobacteriovoraceae bacterium]
MIYEVNGDILLSKAHAVAHGVAPNDDFKKGLAYSLRENWPSLYKDFRNYSHKNHPKEGSVWTWMNAEGKKIVNLFTQEHSRGHNSHPGKATTSYVNHSLKELRKVIEDEDIKSIAMPKLATGVGSLDWNEVRPLIDKHLGDLKIPIYIYTEFHKGQQADEPN